MTRIIKFRAWDKEENRMWWNVQDAYDMLHNHSTPDPEIDDNDNLVFEPCSFGQVLFEKDRYMLQQFTGLLDKNGKEIYEGDIVVRGKNKPVVITFGKQEYVDIDPAFGLDYVGFSPELVKYEWEEIEVIGNIYENSNLIK